MTSKKVLTLVFALCAGTLLCSCQPGATAAKTTTTTAAPVQETQVYEAGNLFQITLLPEMEQMDMPVSQNQFVMSFFDGKETYKNLQVMGAGVKKSSLTKGFGGYDGDVNSLETFSEFMKTFLSGNAMNLSWDSLKEDQMEGMLRCLTGDGKATQKNGSADMAVKFSETETMYFAVIMTGPKEQLKQAKAVAAVSEMEVDLTKEPTTIDFFYSMTAVLDRVNGSNAMSLMKQIYDLMPTASGDSSTGANKENEKNVEAMKSQAQKNLETSWEVTDRASLDAMVKWLMEEGHNQGALDTLTEFGAGQDMSREALEEKMKESALFDTDRIYLRAAFDARAAYGDAALKAWDLSRAVSILEMGYAAGYYTYEETLDGILEVAVLTQQTFDSWDSYNQSYLYGYSYWAEESLEDSGSRAYERKEIVKEAGEEAAGPFTVDWNLELKKEW